MQVYQWKLLNHVAKDHGKTLKPAHLSYKCTVCTATFGQYKLFENHVYTAHSGVAKNKGDKNKQVGGWDKWEHGGDLFVCGDYEPDHYDHHGGKCLGAPGLPPRPPPRPRPPS